MFSLFFFSKARKGEKQLAPPMLSFVRGICEEGQALLCRPLIALAEMVKTPLKRRGQKKKCDRSGISRKGEGKHIRGIEEEKGGKGQPWY